MCLFVIHDEYAQENDNCSYVDFTVRIGRSGAEERAACQDRVVNEL